jgi:hypothetical protein
VWRAFGAFGAFGCAVGKGKRDSAVRGEAANPFQGFPGLVGRGEGKKKPPVERGRMELIFRMMLNLTFQGTQDQVQHQCCY